MDYFGSFGSTRDEALDVLLPLVDELLESLGRGDYEAYCALITESLKSKISRESFDKTYEETQPKLGNLQTLRFLGSLNRNGNPRLVFEAKYEACADDILINITFSNDTAPPRVDWMWME